MRRHLGAGGARRPAQIRDQRMCTGRVADIEALAAILGRCGGAAAVALGSAGAADTQAVVHQGGFWVGGTLPTGGGGGSGGAQAG